MDIACKRIQYYNATFAVTKHIKNNEFVHACQQHAFMFGKPTKTTVSQLQQEIEGFNQR